MEQNYSNHRRLVPMYHVVLFLTLVATTVGSAINLYKSLDTSGLYSASLIFVLTVAVLILSFLARTFALKAQDRAIRVEENLRNYVRNGKLLDSRLTIRQIIGLRFASDDEYSDLAKKAVEENLSENDIKKAIKNWKSDTYRV